MATATCEFQWLHFLLQDFQMNFTTPSIPYCDNQAASHSSVNPIFYEQTKHIEIDCQDSQNFYFLNRPILTEI